MTESPDSGGSGLRVIVSISALIQIYSYAVVVCWSLFIGPADYVLPVKAAFFSIVLIILRLSIGEVLRSLPRWKQVPKHNTRNGLVTGLGGIVSMAFIGIYGGLAILRAISMVDLQNFDLQVRIFALGGILAVVGFTYYVILDIRKSVREDKEIGPIATLPLPQPSGRQ